MRLHNPLQFAFPLRFSVHKFPFLVTMRLSFNFTIMQNLIIFFFFFFFFILLIHCQDESLITRTNVFVLSE